MAALAAHTLTDDQIAVAVNKLRNGFDLNFQDRANRDAVWAKLQKHEKQRFVRTSIRNQQLDPRYTVEGAELPDKGLGNDYRHFFSAIYSIDRRR